MIIVVMWLIIGVMLKIMIMNKMMVKAQAAWKKKFDDESMCDKIKRVVTNSPRKRKYDSDSSSSPEGNSSRRRIDADAREIRGGMRYSSDRFNHPI